MNEPCPLAHMLPLPVFTEDRSTPRTEFHAEFMLLRQQDRPGSFIISPIDAKLA